MSTTRYAVLGLLSIEPMSGYDIRAHLQDSVSHFWTESYGQIYPVLKALAHEKLATVSTGPGTRGRRVYAITPAGRMVLRKWLERPPRLQPPRNELLLKIFLGRHTSPAAIRRHLAAFVERQQAMLAMLDGVREQLRAERRTHPDLPYWLIAVDAGRALRLANIAWAKRSQRTLARAQRKRP
jgi:PadR family transcriptional regulator, regulatory protein AphA